MGAKVNMYPSHGIVMFDKHKQTATFDSFQNGTFKKHLIKTHWKTFPSNVSLRLNLSQISLQVD